MININTKLIKIVDCEQKGQVVPNAKIIVKDKTKITVVRLKTQVD